MMKTVVKTNTNRVSRYELPPVCDIVNRPVVDARVLLIVRISYNVTGSKPEQGDGMSALVIKNLPERL
jgi:hypothetical protein